eukprot:2932490-Rhodomonas_salina.1
MSGRKKLRRSGGGTPQSSLGNHTKKGRDRTSPLSPRNMSRARSRSKSNSPSDGSGLPRGTSHCVINLLTTAA